MFLSFLSNHWRKLLIPLIFMTAFAVYLFIPREQASDNQPYFQQQIPTQSTLIESMNATNNERTEGGEFQSEDVPLSIIVDVQGAVKFPGVYELTEEERLIDAIQAAGGYETEADTRLINHAQKVTDEMFIYIPRIGEDPLEEPLFTTVQTGNANSGNQDGLVNLNTATEAELTTLAGIGPSKAAAIIQYREEQGKFQSIEELKNVTGIGDKTFEKLQNEITVK